MLALIFGVSGQDGYYLTDLLKANDVKVIGISRKNADVKGDISDFDFVDSLITQFQPDYIFHFAANSTTHHSALFENHQSISTGTLNILESVRLHSPASRVFFSGSAMQFKNTGLPIDEETPFEASSAYSVARIQSVYAARYYRNTFGMKIYIGYLFNHDSPFRSEKHVNQKIVNAVKRIRKGNLEQLSLGNIEVKKEFNFAGDVVEAMWILVNQDIIFETVIGSGISYSIKDWTAYCFKKINKDWTDFVVMNENFKSEYANLVSQPSLINSLGWKAKVNFHELADLMMNEIEPD
jgi:GDPmannose 4,6-dehydratase